MAIEVYSKKEKRYGILEQATFGTAATEGSSVIELNISGTTIDPDVKIRETEQAHGTIRSYTDELIADTKRSAPIISIPDVEAKQDYFDYFLYLALHSVVEGEATPFKKTFTIPSTRPDFSANAGFFATFFERFPYASSSRKVADCIARSLTITGAPGEPLKFSAELIGRGSVTENDNPSATWTIPGNNFWYWEDMAVTKVNSVTRRLQAFTITIDLDPKFYGNDGSGNFETFAIDPIATFKLTIGENMENSHRQGFMTAWKAGTLWAYQIGWGNATPGTDDGDLDFAWNGKITKVTPLNEDILAFDVEGKMLTSAIATSPLTIIMANAIERTW